MSRRFGRGFVVELTPLLLKLLLLIFSPFVLRMRFHFGQFRAISGVLSLQALSVMEEGRIIRDCQGRGLGRRRLPIGADASGDAFDASIRVLTTLLEDSS